MAVSLKCSKVAKSLARLHSRLVIHLIRLCFTALGAEDPLLVDFPIIIKVPGKDLAVAAGDLALLDSLPNAQLALLYLQHP